ncbi:transposase [Clostridium estertheticum]|uniref:REP-associated tyrosine transposase n=1 Tax=Clostridium estertheticum TaxID=238834 RepID=UPI001C6EC141|nr:transposase [Clostridium estertheticum]MBW9172912.1 transposase [Clostridium estertheticum]WLC75248.1 transposase [Clostridium estertheticum]
MTSPARIWYPNTSYHITARGNRRSDIFKDDEDFQIYLSIIEETMEHFSNDYEIICYCLMDNHIHILLKTKERHMKDFMARVNSIYAKFFNDKYNYVGHLYQDRYFAELIESDSQMLDTSRYIHLNPVKANMVEKPGEYQWSSYSMYIGEKREKIITSKILLSYFKKGKEKKLYKKFVESTKKDKYKKEEVEIDGISSK